MPWSFIIPAAASLLGAKMQSDSATKAAETSAAATQQAADVQRQIFERQVELQEPWRQAGMTALNKLIPMATQYTPFGAQQFQADPGYAFRLAEGQKALERQAAARGGLISGSALKAAQRYGQEMGSQEYQNAFNRYQAERAAALNPLQSLAGVGQTSVNALTGAAGAYGTNIGNLYQQQGINAANAALARGSAYGTGLRDIGYLAGRYYGQPSPAGSSSGMYAGDPYSNYGAPGSPTGPG